MCLVYEKWKNGNNVFVLKMTALLFLIFIYFFDKLGFLSCEAFSTFAPSSTLIIQCMHHCRNLIGQQDLKLKNSYVAVFYRLCLIKESLFSRVHNLLALM